MKKNSNSKKKGEIFCLLGIPEISCNFVEKNRITMEREVLVKKMIGRIEQLPTNRIHEVNDFMEFIISRANDSLVTRELQQLALLGNTFDFLDKEPDLYTVNDLKVRFA